MNRLHKLLEPISANSSDYVLTLCSEFVVMVGQFLLYRIAAHTMGALGFSELAVARRIAGSAQSFMLLGLTVALPRYMGLIPSQMRATSYPKYMAASLQSIALWLLVVAALLLGFKRQVAYLIWGDDNYVTLIGPLLMMLAGLSLHGVVYSFFRGDLQMRRANLFHVVNIGIVPVLIIAAGARDTSTLLMRMGVWWTVIAAVGLLFTPLRLAFRRNDIQLRELLSYGIQRVPGDIMVLVLTTIPVAITAHMGGVVQAGFLSFAMTVVFSIAAIFSPVSVVLLPKASRMLAAGQTEELRDHVLALVAISFAISAAAVIVGEATAGFIIPVYLGPRLSGATAVVRQVLPAAIALTLIAVLRGVVDALYRRAVMTISTAVGFVLFATIAGVSYLHGRPGGIVFGFVLGWFAICTFSAAAAWTAVQRKLKPSRVQVEQCTPARYPSALGGLGPLSREARSYALKELARRAGVSSEFVREWRIQHTSMHTTVQLPGARRQIRFFHADPRSWSVDAKTCIGRGTWMFPEQQEATGINDFVVPFVPADGGRPLFSYDTNGDIECRVDLLASIVLTLSRAEELADPKRDGHGRFLASQSVASQNGFLLRPIVDEYGFAFEQVIRDILPAWRPVRREMYVKLTHDIDHVGIPFSLRQILGYGIRRRSDGNLKDLVVALFGRSQYLSGISRLVNIAQQHGLRSALYWKASSPARYDSGYNPDHPLVRALIDEMQRRGCEIGFHPGYNTFLNPPLLAKEFEDLRAVTGVTPMGGRQHYLRWHPKTWSHWEDCGLTYDSSVGYSDQLGFRAGTCIPYHPWLLSENRESRLLELPLIAMDTTLITHHHLREGGPYPELFTCIDRCQQVGGVFVLLWHNSNFTHAGDVAAYKSVLSRLSGRRSFDSPTTESLAREFHLSYTLA